MLTPQRGLRVAAVPPRAANLTGLARDADGMAGRDEGTGALIEPRNMDRPQMAACRIGHPPDTVTCPMVGETENASHTRKSDTPWIFMPRRLPGKLLINLSPLKRLSRQALAGPAIVPPREGRASRWLAQIRARQRPQQCARRQQGHRQPGDPVASLTNEVSDEPASSGGQDRHGPLRFLRLGAGRHHRADA
jgi:hypothetical protein